MRSRDGQRGRSGVARRILAGCAAAGLVVAALSPCALLSAPDGRFPSDLIAVAMQSVASAEARGSSQAESEAVVVMRARCMCSCGHSGLATAGLFHLDSAVIAEAATEDSPGSYLPVQLVADVQIETDHAAIEHVPIV